MRALVVAPEPFFTPRGTPFSVYYRSLVLAEQGVAIDMLTYGEGEDVSIPGLRIIRIPHWRFLGAVKAGPSALKAFLDVLLFARMVTLLLRRPYDFVCAHEESAFFCVLLKPLFRFRLVYDMHSSLPQQLENFQFTHSRLLIGLFRKLEGLCLRHADAVVTVSPALADYALARIPDSSRHWLIENSMLEPVRLRDSCGSRGSAAAEGANETRGLPEPIPSGRFIIVYAGTLEEYQGVDMLLSAFARLRALREEPLLIVVGGQPDQIRLYCAMAEELGVGADCLFTGRVDQRIARRYLRKADLLVSIRQGGMNTPSKIYEQLASAVPLVATRVLAHTQIVNDSICILADPNPESIAAGMMKVLRDPAAAAETARRAHEFFERRYSRAAYEEKVRELLAFLRRLQPAPG